jgi:DeoD family purine-nucleoside phosphorylase
MPQIHLRAEPGDYAPIVLLPGDPNRATTIASLFDGGLEAARKVNEHRLAFGYTGTFGGVPVSVQTTGMGAPSAAIVVEELLRLGARRLVRVGTCGGIGRGIRTGEIVIASAAAAFDGTTATYLHGEPYAPAADFTLVRALVDAAEDERAAYHVGPVCTVDVFYNPDADYFSRWAARGILAFEMESSALFYLAARAYAAGDDVRAASILTVSDVLGPNVTSEDSYLPLDELEKRTAAMLHVALAAATSPAVAGGL